MSRKHRAGHGRGGQGADNRVGPGSVSGELRLEERGEEERVRGQFRDADLAVIVVAGEPQPVLGQRVQVVRVETERAVITLDGPLGAQDPLGQGAGRDPDGALVTDQRAAQRDDQEPRRIRPLIPGRYSA